MMRCTGSSMACLLLLSTLGSIQLISASDLPDVGKLLNATNQIKQGVLANMGQNTVTTAPVTTTAVTSTTGAPPTTTAAPPTTTTAATPTTTTAATSTPSPTSTAQPTTSSTPTSTTASTTCASGTKLVNGVCVLLCASATDNPADPCANAGYPTNSGYIDYTNATPGDVSCEPDIDGVNFYVTYTHSVKTVCSTDADCGSDAINPAGGAVCSTNNKTYCHQGASASLCPASGRKLLQA